MHRDSSSTPRGRAGASIPVAGEQMHAAASPADDRMSVGRVPSDPDRGSRLPKLRLLHMADVHLGARHQDLGTAATAQRERQFAAFEAALALAVRERVAVVLVAGDLFDSNTQPRRTVERVAAAFRAALQSGVRVVVIPGTHDVYDPSSVYRTYDLPAMAGVAGGDDGLVVLHPDRPEVVFPALDLVVYGRVFATKRAPRSPLAEFSASAEERARWRVGMLHGSLRIPGRTENDEVVFTEQEVAASGLDYLALGHWHSFRQGVSGGTTWAYPGAPEPVAVDQDGAGQVLLVELELKDGARTVRVTPRPVGRTRFLRVDIDAAGLASQETLIDQLLPLADPDLVVDVRLTGVLPDSLDLDEDEVERRVGDHFFRYRLQNLTVAPLPEGPLPPADTIAGAFVRDLEARIDAAAAAGRPDEAEELREMLRLGRLLLDGQTVTLA